MGKIVSSLAYMCFYTGVNPARTFCPSMVDCMAGICSQVVGTWYWIYWIGPFAASLVVAEVTEWIHVSVEAEEAEELQEELKPEQAVKQVDTTDSATIASGAPIPAMDMNL